MPHLVFLPRRKGREHGTRCPVDFQNLNAFQNGVGPKTLSSIQPLDLDTPLPIREWQQRYERYLDLTGRKETRNATRGR
jgi:hypothetical protein